MSEETKTIKSTIQAFGKKLFGFIRGKVRSNEDAEDILQDVWYQLSSFGNLEDIENVSAWLYQVARNKVTDRYRKKSTDSLDDYAFEDADGDLIFKEILLLDDSNDPDLALFKETFWKELEKALEELPENQREVFVLNEMEDLTLQQIADLKGEKLKTIISRKGYAVKHLRNRLNYLYEELNY
ncbi:sigma-70 family RNA polymerase sigma factor [Lacihabitans sp. LS3-19]|uniref:RNA polymerase sigma factor n=1 Tax=Lacihabitans sp. LS3-19 TaxID=2487335 RepID=UPI0020CDEB54|nr:sigma-70 family RNA polymerase sigma factor [Lacihabitans sp. LS3-19]MCP9768615.1 sigma-70 family RNA polymerase sigma factor [Lacihabitans sp. LS3-19]